MDKNEFNNLPEINTPAKKQEKKKVGFLSRILRGFRTPAGSAVKGSAPNVSGVGNLLSKGAKGVGSLSAKGSSFGAAKGFGTLFSSKAGVLGLLLGSATIAEGAALLFNLAKDPQAALTQGLFQGTNIYNEMAGTMADSARDNEAQADSALDPYFNLDVEGSDENFSSGPAAMDESANFESGQMDASAVAAQVAKSKKDTAAKLKASSAFAGSGTASGGSGAGAGAGAANMQGQFRGGKVDSMASGIKTTKSSSKLLARKGASAGSAFESSGHVKSGLSDAMKSTTAERAKIGGVSAWDASYGLKDPRKAYTLGGSPKVAKGSGIGAGSPRGDETATGEGGGIPDPRKDTNIDEDDDLNGEKAPDEVSKAKGLILGTVIFAVVAMFASAYFIRKPGARAFARIGTGISAAASVAALIQIAKFKKDYPYWADQYTGFLAVMQAVCMATIAYAVIINTLKEVKSEKDALADGDMKKGDDYKKFVEKQLKKTLFKALLETTAITGAIGFAKSIEGDFEKDGVPKPEESGETESETEEGDE